MVCNRRLDLKIPLRQGSSDSLWYCLPGILNKSFGVSQAAVIYRYRARCHCSISCPTAWIFSQFAAANMGTSSWMNMHRLTCSKLLYFFFITASVVLISSNPTNLVLSGAFSLSFVTYTAHCFIPFLFAAIFVYPVLVLGLFRSRDMIPRSISLGVADGEDFGTTMVDKRGAIFGSVLLLVTLGTLVGTSVVGVPVWEVTVPPAIIMFMRDLHHDWTRHAPDRSRFPQEAISRQTGGTSAEDQMELQILPSGPQSSQAISTKPPTTLLYKQNTASASYRLHSPPFWLLCDGSLSPSFPLPSLCSFSCKGCPVKAG